MFYAHVLREKQGIPVLHAHITLTTFTQFAQNGTVGCMLVLYGPTMHMATLKPYIFRPDKAMNLPLLYEDIWTGFFSA